MTRARNIPQSRKRRKKILKMAKGYRGARSKLIRTARDTVKRALVYAYRDRKQRKRDFRRLWIVRINAALREMGLKYSTVINHLKKQNINLNRKVLADMAFHDPEGFKQFISSLMD